MPFPLLEGATLAGTLDTGSVDLVIEGRTTDESRLIEAHVVATSP